MDEFRPAISRVSRVSFWQFGHQMSSLVISFILSFLTLMVSISVLHSLHDLMTFTSVIGIGRDLPHINFYITAIVGSYLSL
jgi:ABC-type long-subunit fatty acid transport system fused permease/ATPase subunit